MYVTKLCYENFRNLKDGCFEPAPGINVIFGDNAQGKTNLIEGLWLFSGQKSFRNVKDAQLVKLQQDEIKPARLQMDFFAAGRKQTAQISIQNRRSAQLNQIPLPAPAALGQSFCAVVFSPDDMDLLKDAPAGRRSFLNNAIAALRPKYDKMLQLYNRAVQQRNALLRDVQFHSELTALLDIYEDRIAKTGAYLISRRMEYVAALMRHIPKIFQELSDGSERPMLTYRCSAGDGGEQAILQALQQSRGEDTKTGFTGVGPHRDDFLFCINGLPVKQYGSQGQLRSAVLSIKLAQAELLKTFSGEQPIAILDDVMSELDAFRRDYILNHINGWQVFITCCDPEPADRLVAGARFQMRAGVLERVGGAG